LIFGYENYFLLSLRNGENLKLGDLTGNHFKLVIREVNEKIDENIIECIESFKNIGFINYFGLQRFGNSIEAPTHQIGKLLIQNKIKEAIEMILRPRKNSYEKCEIKKAREVWESSNHDANRALVYLDRVNCLEKYLLNGLSQSDKNDYLGAFQFIPRNMRLMYLHAYQSYVWNEAVSERIKLFGLKPCVGDLVIKKKIIKGVVKSEDKEVIMVNETNLKDFDIYDVVLPLPGHDIKYPNNDSIKLYFNILVFSVL
jgi:tRNA pseudouridine13 synthase